MEKMTDIIKGRGAKAPLSRAPSMVLKGSLNERERRLYVDKVNTDNKVGTRRGGGEGREGGREEEGRMEGRREGRKDRGGRDEWMDG
jgi:hypothetical protein